MISKDHFLQTVKKHCSEEQIALSVPYAELWWMVSSPRLPVMAPSDANLVRVQRVKEICERYAPSLIPLFEKSKTQICIEPIRYALVHLGLYNDAWYFHDGEETEWGDGDQLVDEADLGHYRLMISKMKESHGAHYRGELYTILQRNPDTQYEKQSYAIPSSNHYDLAFEKFVSPEIRAQIEAYAEELAQKEELAL
ncbi:hypothetical protein [Vibrio crassostreae]|uniref:hypothetical protein n=1 Tax=Vibrio crassostreae TaxID=246167 RepID=UPI001B30B7A2|nr:hypothetical protein [Vibrio crassostreae]